MTPNSSTRRAFIAAAAAAPVALSCANQATANQASAPSLDALIEVHRGACAEVSAARYRLQLLASKCEMSPVCVPIAVTPDGKQPLGSLDVKLGRETIEARIEEAHAEMVNMHITQFARQAAPEAVDAMRAAIERSRRSALAAIGPAEREREELRRRLGISDAAADLDRQLDAESEAAAAIIFYRPRTDAEAAAKAAYLEDEDGLGEAVGMAPRLAAALSRARA